MLQTPQASSTSGFDDAENGGENYLLHSAEDLAGFVEEAVRHALRNGFEAVNADAMEHAGITMGVRNGQPETSKRDANQSLTVRLFRDGRTGAASTASFSRDSIHRTVERAASIAGVVEEDHDAAPADKDWLEKGSPSIPLFQPSQLSPSQLADVALAIEAEALRPSEAQNARVLNVGASSADTHWARAIGTDFLRSGSGSAHSCWCSVIVSDGDRMCQDHWSSTDRRVERLESPAQIAGSALARARRKIGATGLSTRTCPVLLDAVIAGTFVSELAGALSGSAQDQKSTFLLDALGNRVAAAHLHLIEDPFEPYGLASGNHDSEGVGSHRRHVMREGIVEGYFLSSRTARRLGLPPTGNANGAWNLSLCSHLTEAGDDIVAMLRRMERGLWVTEILGGGVNAVTGAYSKAVAGFWVENGRPVHPVQDITIAGTFPTLLAAVRGIGADVHRAGAIRTGSILLDDMQLAGR